MKTLLHFLNGVPWGENLCFAVGGILAMNLIALRVTACRPGHALACIPFQCHELSMCIMQEQSGENAGNSLCLLVLIKPQCVSWHHTVAICESVPHNCCILINSTEMSLSSKNHQCGEKRMLINDSISVKVPHHTADDKLGGGSSLRHIMWVSPLLVLSGGGRHQSRAALLSPPRRGAVTDKGGSS